MKYLINIAFLFFSVAAFGQNGMLLAAASSGFDTIPTELDSLVLWLKADSGITDSSGLVKQWNDQSGNGFNMIQTDPTKMPSYGTNTLNGINSVTFSFDFMSGTLTTFDCLNFDRDEITVFAVINPTSNTNTLFSDIGGAGSRLLIHPQYVGNITYWDAGNASSARISGVLTFNNDILTAYRNGATMFVNKNGIEEITTIGASGLASIDAVMIIGAYNTAIGDPFIGDIYELIIYNRALTSDEITAIENYLNTKYSIY